MPLEDRKRKSLFMSRSAAGKCTKMQSAPQANAKLNRIRSPTVSDVCLWKLVRSICLQDRQMREFVRNPEIQTLISRKARFKVVFWRARFMGPVVGGRKDD